MKATGYNSDETKILVDNNSTGIYNVYLLNIGDTTMEYLTNSSAEPIMLLTFYREQVNLFAHTIKAIRIIIYILANKGDTMSKDLTPSPNSTNSFFEWSADKKSDVYKQQPAQS